MSCILWFFFSLSVAPEPQHRSRASTTGAAPAVPSGSSGQVRDELDIVLNGIPVPVLLHDLLELLLLLEGLLLGDDDLVARPELRSQRGPPARGAENRHLPDARDEGDEELVAAPLAQPLVGPVGLVGDGEAELELAEALELEEFQGEVVVEVAAVFGQAEALDE